MSEEYESGGLESDEESEPIVYLQSNQGFICDFEEKYLKNINLVTAIITGDNTAGRSEDNPIPLSFVDNEIMLILQQYISHHGENDYVPKARVYDETYNEKLTRWDRQFLNDLNLFNENSGDKLKRLYNALQYLMYDSFCKKLSCRIGNLQVLEHDYLRLFTLPPEEEESEEDEKKEE